MPTATDTDEQLSIPEAAKFVDLYVCLRCGNVGKAVGVGASMASKCVGPRGGGHKKTSMVLVRYEAQSVVEA